jgi:hypothetical protein
MKRIILMAFFASLFSQFTYAQFTLGLKGGVNTSKIYTDAGSFKSNFNESLDTKTGYVFGLYARAGNKFFIQPEVLFATKGGKVNVVPLGGGSPVQVNIKTNNIDVPVLIGYKLFKVLRINAGPVASFKINEDEKFVQELRNITGNIDQAFANATFGYQAGVGITILGFDIDLRKDGSLSEISNAKFGNDDRFNQRISGWQLTLGRKIL